MADSSQRLVQILANTLNPNGEIRARAELDLAGVLEEAGTFNDNEHGWWLIPVDIVESILQVFTTYDDVSIRQISNSHLGREAITYESTVLV
jgi:hypothetical protein